MSKAENRHHTQKWKKRRKNHLGDKCGNPKCGICSIHKRAGGNYSKFDNKRNKLYRILKKISLNAFD